MSQGLALAAVLLLGACSLDASPPAACGTDADCRGGACRDSVCIFFATPLDEPVDPGDPPDAGDAAP